MSASAAASRPLAIAAAFPSPFREEALVLCDLPDATPITLDVADVHGRVRRRLVAALLPDVADRDQLGLAELAEDPAVDLPKPPGADQRGAHQLRPATPPARTRAPRYAWA